MHISLTTALKKVFGSKDEERERKIAELKAADHTYIRGPIEARGPCPGLNALCNQGYLPRDGLNMTLIDVEAALTAALHMNTLAASSLAGALKPLLRKDGTFDMVDTRRHNVVEHDASFTRLDIGQGGDNYSLQPALLEALVNDAKGGPISVKSMARTYKRRLKESKEAGSPKLGIRLTFVNLLQAAGLINTASQPGDVLPVELVKTFYTEERFPPEILDNTVARTVFGLLWRTVKVTWHIVFSK